jgi:hypothetical protein
MRFSYAYSELLPSTEELERVMGYRSDDAPEPLTRLITEVRNELTGMDHACAEYLVCKQIKCNTKDKTIEIDGVLFDVKPIIHSQIKDAEEIALFIATAGYEVGRRSHFSMKEGDLLRGYVYDVIGSEVAENAAARMQTELKESSELRGMKITNRFSPGYCGWDVADQQKLFSFFRDNSCGITLTESSLMNPVKSVSGMIGIGTKVKFRDYPCKKCDDHNCIFRGRR